MPKMKKADWNGLDHFTVDEKWGDPYKMDRDLLYLLEYMRILLRRPFIVHCGYQHRPKKPTSQHNYGTAADGHVKGMAFKNVVDLFLQSLETLTIGEVRMLFPKFMAGKYKDYLVADYIGLGIYPHWNRPGIHIDTRLYRARWGALNVGGKQTYYNNDDGFQYVYSKI